jgi:AraC-like DNA-binding protein
MSAVGIPENLIHEPRKISAYHYQSFQELHQQQIQLSKHAFSFLEVGTKEVLTPTNKLSIASNSFLLMRAGHCLMTEKLAKNETYQSTLLFFDASSLYDILLKHQISPRKPSKPQGVYSFKQTAYIRGLVTGIKDVLKLPEDLQPQLLLLKLEELIVYLYHYHGAAFLYGFNHLNSPAKQQLIQVVDAYKYKKLRLEELAFLTHMSVSNFKREFVKTYGQSPIKWFQEQRLTLAAYQLRDRGQRVSDVYEAAGYESLSSFINAFKNKFGCTPKKFQ